MGTKVPILGPQLKYLGELVACCTLDVCLAGTVKWANILLANHLLPYYLVNKPMG